MDRCRSSTTSIHPDQSTAEENTAAHLSMISPQNIAALAAGAWLRASRNHDTVEVIQNLSWTE
nr:hypothetical protein JVH1_6683 [Rhodococcus sp. JVH1]